jgi:hypothetical protein
MKLEEEMPIVTALRKLVPCLAKVVLVMCAIALVQAAANGGIFNQSLSNLGNNVNLVLKDNPTSMSIALSAGSIVNNETISGTYWTADHYWEVFILLTLDDFWNDEITLNLWIRHDNWIWGQYSRYVNADYYASGAHVLTDGSFAISHPRGYDKFYEASLRWNQNSLDEITWWRFSRSAAHIPEPASFWLVLPGGLLMLRARRRRT